MKKPLPTSPYDSSRYVGSVIFVSPDSAKINLPYASSVSAKQYAGFTINGGQVGEFVFIEGEKFAVLGRITEVRLPDSERLNAEPALGKIPDAHPIGFVQLLTTLELTKGKVISGLPQHPRVGQFVFSAHPLLVKHIIENSEAQTAGMIELATTTQEAQTRINISPSLLLGRHCAVLGATGGGKSWTVARILQEIERIGGKVILIDPTGEFHTFDKNTSHVFLGGSKKDEADKREYVGFPYWELTELDLFAIFQPSGASQAPKLREALRSLKLLYVLNQDKEPFTYIKAKTSRKEFNRTWAKNEAEVEKEGAKYLIKNLCKQIFEECVHDTDFNTNDPNDPKWGGPDEKARSYCETLVVKIYSITKSKALKCLFEPEIFVSLTDKISEFINSKERILRISMEELPFEHNARELLTNALGRHLLNMAREKTFQNSPLVVVLDEAHQFLNKNVGDENNRIELNAFGLIAKEGRKYGLTTLIATQRPRDIPEDVLSQMGMFIVHRLINERDRQVVESACGSLDASAAAFLPTLGQGEAILVGVDFPMPTPVKILEPEFPPKSEGPAYSELWKT